MTTPLVTIEPDATITEAARRMNRLDIRRLGVIYKGNLVGIISSKDVLGVMPELIEIIQERSRIEDANRTEEDEEVPLQDTATAATSTLKALKNETDKTSVMNAE